MSHAEKSCSKKIIQTEIPIVILTLSRLRGYTSVNAENLGDFREFFERKVLN